jgi:ubiquinone/menaquinone biosynthesis C-methylase UbiE
MANIDAHSSPSRRYYDRVARFYDGVVELFYGHARRAAVERLQLDPGNVVLDVACGTGLNFAHVVERIGDAGILVGLDGSSRMLDRARERTRREGWSSVVRLIEYDARAISPELISGLIPDNRTVDRVLFTLALSVIPDWEQVFRAAFELLPPGGRCVIMDEYAPKRGLVTRFIERVASADISRRVWEPLRELSSGYEEEDLARARNPGTAIVVASGVKP